MLQKGNVISFVYQPGSISYSQVDLPDGDFLEMTFNVKATTSFCIVYVSVSVANPGPALYDAKFKISAVSKDCFKKFAALFLSKTFLL